MFDDENIEIKKIKFDQICTTDEEDKSTYYESVVMYHKPEEVAHMDEYNMFA